MPVGKTTKTRPRVCDGHFLTLSDLSGPGRKTIIVFATEGHHHNTMRQVGCEAGLAMAIASPQNGAFVCFLLYIILTHYPTGESTRVWYGNITPL